MKIVFYSSKNKIRNSLTEENEKIEHLCTNAIPQSSGNDRIEAIDNRKHDSSWYYLAWRMQGQKED